MANRLIKSFCFVAITLIVINACVNNSLESITPTPDTTINLKWFNGSFSQTEDEMRTGFAWALSSLGAEIPTGSLDILMTEITPNVYQVDLSKAAFSGNSLNALGVVVSTLKNSPAYEMNNYVEMGRFIMLTLNSSYHYYEITQLPKTLSEFKSNYEFAGKKMRIINSGISNVERLVEISEADQFGEIAYKATEGLGSFEEGTFSAVEFEVFDFMANGQLRFGLYDLSGNLKAVADPEITRAGKPGKCLWCHEINIQPFFTSNPVLSGADYLSADQFSQILNNQNLFLAEHRDALDSEINFMNLQDHRLMEYLYIDFMEPAIARIAEEWNMEIEEAEEFLKDVPTHTQSEYGIKNLFHRNDIEHLAPFSSIEVPESAREFSMNEPNFFDF